MQDARAREALGSHQTTSGFALCFSLSSTFKQLFQRLKNTKERLQLTLKIVPSNPRDVWLKMWERKSQRASRFTGQTTQVRLRNHNKQLRKDRYGPYLFLRPEKDDRTENNPELGTLQKQQGTAESPFCSSWFRLSSERSSAVSLPLRQRRDSFRLITWVAWRLKCKMEDSLYGTRLVEEKCQNRASWRPDAYILHSRCDKTPKKGFCL